MKECDVDYSYYILLSDFFVDIPHKQSVYSKQAHSKYTAMWRLLHVVRRTYESMAAFCVCSQIAILIILFRARVFCREHRFLEESLKSIQSIFSVSNLDKIVRKLVVSWNASFRISSV